MTPQESRQVFRLIMAAWTTQRQKLSSEDIETMAAIYTAGLADIDVSLVKAAVQRLVRTSQWLPTIAEIRDACGVVVHGMQKTGGEAWGSVVRAMSEQGGHRTPGQDFVFTDQLTARVVKALGWGELCRSDNRTADRARFIETYEQIAKNERTEAKAQDGAVSKVLPLRPGITAVERIMLGEAVSRVLDAAQADPSDDNDSGSKVG